MTRRATVLDHIDQEEYSIHKVIISDGNWYVASGDQEYPIDKSDFSYTGNNGKMKFDFASQLASQEKEIREQVTDEAKKSIQALAESKDAETSRIQAANDLAGQFNKAMEVDDSKVDPTESTPADETSSVEETSE